MKRAVLLFVLALGCKSAESPSPPTRTVQLSLLEVDCGECAVRVRKEVAKSTPVRAFVFDKKRVVISLTVDATISDEVVLAAASRAGIKVRLGAEGGSYLPDESAPAGADVAIAIADGSDIADLSSLAVAGKVTVVDFFAGWCGPCRVLDAHVKKRISGRADLAYRRLDIVDWDTPLAKHWMNDVAEFPYVVVFDKHKKQVDVVVGADLDKLDAVLAKAGAP